MKKIAKQRLKGVYFYSVIVCLVYMYIMGDLGRTIFGLVYKYTMSSLGTTFIIFGDWTSSIPTLGELLPKSNLTYIILGALYLVIILPVVASIKWFFLDVADGEKTSWRVITGVFTRTNYLRYFQASLLILIFVVCWTFLLFIFGLVKSYSYSQTFRLMRDNPDLGALEAITLSRNRMRGHKFNLFLLQLSFILWFIIPIGVQIAGIATGNQNLEVLAGFLYFAILIFIGPYYQTTNAVFYREEIRYAPL
ncbi:hypothetical protein PWEIH_09271 [Listeria weihenstephanensis FSL R9-0317]|uniref:DUF975 family protein n=1 Tax=Listeria weihenstephanensis TaxID=1006155 RepID=A0A1S7FXZ0_9LIST|nr:DUF975 family protein [Listeria weihenstephanensis]AQY52278.1 hypothetical protein UE46_15475 [Listeria weihenstephanensis]EUJ38646.1 hypothetical protein PWEIH_09271 [Listeria weihenstephanensis FSL R9-0317]